MRLRAGISLMTVAAVLVGCGGGGRPAPGRAGGGSIQVVASFYPVAEAAARVGGDQVKVTNLTPAGSEPHDLELTPEQVDKLQDADLVVFVGGGFQPAVQAAVEGRRGPTLDVLDGLAVGRGPGGKVDPHFWLDPRLLSSAAAAIEGGLVAIAPSVAGPVGLNAARYRQELATLDGAFEAGLSRCRRRTIVTAHAAFGYLARRYGLVQEPIAGLSPESEPDARRLDALVALIARTATTTVFYETLVSPRVADTLAREAGVATAVLDPIEGLADDDLRAGGDYGAAMNRNLAALRAALGCQ